MRWISKAFLSIWPTWNKNRIWRLNNDVRGLLNAKVADPKIQHMDDRFAIHFMRFNVADAPQFSFAQHKNHKHMLCIRVWVCACDIHRMKRRLFSKKWLHHSNTERLWLKWLSIQFQSEANQSMDKCPREMYYICWCNTLMERESFVNDVFAIILCVYFLSVSSVSHQSIGQFMVWNWSERRISTSKTLFKSV